MHVSGPLGLGRRRRRVDIHGSHARHCSGRKKKPCNGTNESRFEALNQKTVCQVPRCTMAVLETRKHAPKQQNHDSNFMMLPSVDPFQHLFNIIFVGLCLRVALRSKYNAQMTANTTWGGSCCKWCLYIVCSLFVFVAVHILAVVLLSVWGSGSHKQHKRRSLYIGHGLPVRCPTCRHLRDRCKLASNQAQVPSPVLNRLNGLTVCAAGQLPCPNRTTV